MRIRKMLKLISVIALLGMVFVKTSESQTLRRAKNYEQINVKIVKKIPLPKWYHEGLFWNGKDIWVCNGKDGKIWVVDTASGSVTSEIEPVAGFTEAVAKKPDGTYFMTDWNEKKLYKVKIENNKMAPQAEVSFEPAHPAGIGFVGSRLFVITWRRGLGTKFNILEVDGGMNVVQKIKIKDIQEPAHMAWDGHHLWITSWFYRCVYKIDMNRLEIVGQFESPVVKATGIAWDGKYLWITGTDSDLFQLEIVSS